MPILVAALVALSLGPAWLALAPDATVSARSQTLPSIEGWQGPTETRTDDWMPVYEGADAKTLAEYRKAAFRAQLFMATYHVQHQGKELIGYDNSMVGGNASLSRARLESDGQKFNAEEVTTRDGQRALIIYYYSIGPKQTASARTAQLLYGWQSLFAVPASMAVGAYAICESNCDSEQVELVNLLTKIRGGMD